MPTQLKSFGNVDEIFVWREEVVVNDDDLSLLLFDWHGGFVV